MPTLRSLKGAQVTDAKGAALGTVTHVLCDPERAVVVGFEVQPPNLAYVVGRKPRYFALEGARISGELVEVAEPKRWSGERAEKALGFEWERTVIWVGMPIAASSGEGLGYVRDATFDAQSGVIDRIVVSDGMSSDLAVGTREMLGRDVERFDGSRVLMTEATPEAEFSGGVARAAGTGAAVAKVVVGDAAKKAAALGSDAARAAARSKPARSAWSVLRETGKAFKEGMKDEDE